MTADIIADMAGSATNTIQTGIAGLWLLIWVSIDTTALLGKPREV